MIDFKEVWKAPFRNDGLYIWSFNNVMTATNIAGKKGKKVLQDICDALNGGKISGYKDIEVDGCELTINGCLIRIRGWGYLIGIGGLRLKPEEAVKVQDEFINYIVDKIKAD